MRTPHTNHNILRSGVALSAAVALLGTTACTPRDVEYIHSPSPSEIAASDPNIPPEPTCAVEVANVVGSTATFGITAQNIGTIDVPGATNVRYDFGDGPSIRTKNTRAESHDYDNPGAYIVLAELLVTNPTRANDPDPPIAGTISCDAALVVIPQK